MGSSLILILMFRSSKECFTVMEWSVTDSNAPGTWFSPRSTSTMTGKPRAMAPAPAETMTLFSSQRCDEGRDTLLGVGQQALEIAGLDVAEDQGSTDGHGDHMDDGGHVMAQGHHAELQTHLDALLGGLLDAVANHKGHDALGLVILDHVGHLGRFGGLAQDHATPGISPVTRGTPRERMMGSGTKPMPVSLA